MKVVGGMRIKRANGCVDTFGLGTVEYCWIDLCWPQISPQYTATVLNCVISVISAII